MAVGEAEEVGIEEDREEDTEKGTKAEALAEGMETAVDMEAEILVAAMETEAAMAVEAVCIDEALPTGIKDSRFTVKSIQVFGLVVPVIIEGTGSGF